MTKHQEMIRELVRRFPALLATGPLYYQKRTLDWVMRPFNARIDFAARSAGSEGASTVRGGLGKFHRQAIRDAPVRGRTILNSVNSPGCVSTSIDPPCCLTMMS
jgi:hypothetical protein